MQFAVRNAMIATQRRVALWLFIILFASYGYFHQGGGWNQNSRFDQVRSIVENQQLEINEYFRYRGTSNASGGAKIVRFKGAEQVDQQSLTTLPNTLDISIFAGKVYPNKPPGTVFLAVPAYWLVYQVESFLGIDLDDWWVQTVNAYMMTALSVGFLTALGGVVFFLVSRRLFPAVPGWVHIATTLTYGLGTLTFPFATLLFDHNLVAAISLCAFWLLLVEGQGGFESFRTSLSYFLVGVLCGLTLVVNYSAILTSIFLLIYGLCTSKTKISFATAALAGFAVPVMLLLWYHFVCFGSPFATANTYQFGMFRSDDAILFGMLALPKPRVVYNLLFSSYRGLFFSSPVLLLAPVGLFLMIYVHRLWPEALLFIAIFVTYLAMNAGFNNWHAGWTFGPRYLIPVLPFLCLPLTVVFGRTPRLACMLAVPSVTLMIFITAVDPQVPSATANPLADHVLPLIGGKKLEMNGVRIEGPVSVNPIGVYENWDHPISSVSAALRKWHSFNLGEFVTAGSIWSLLPLGIFLLTGFLWIARFLEKTEDRSLKIQKERCLLAKIDETSSM